MHLTRTHSCFPQGIAQAVTVIFALFACANLVVIMLSQYFHYLRSVCVRVCVSYSVKPICAYL